MQVDNLSYYLLLENPSLGESAAENTTKDSMPTFPLIPFVVIIGLTAVLTVIGNAFVCTAIFIHPRLRRVTYLAVCSLSFADLLAGAIAMPAYMLKKLDLFPGELIVCDLFRFSYFLTGYASILNLCIISVERMLVIRSPLSYHTKVTRSRVVTALVLAWLDCLLVSSLPFFPWDSKSPEECHYNPTPWWSIMVIVKNVIAPFIILTSCQVFLWSVARRHLGRIASENTSYKRQTFTKERKANKTIVIIIGLFVLFWFPSCFYYFLRQTCSRCFPETFSEVENIFNAVMKIMTFMSSCANPLVYCWRSREFRQAFCKILLKLNLTNSRNFVEIACFPLCPCKTKDNSSQDDSKSRSIFTTFAVTEKHCSKTTKVLTTVCD